MSPQEMEIESLKQRLREAEQRAGQVEQLLQRTTFHEYLEHCHNILSKPITIQYNKSLATQGTITSPRHKVCPMNLRPWEDFPEHQRQIFDDIDHFFHPPSQPAQRFFSPVSYLRELKRTLVDRKIASERDLESYQLLTLESPVADIVSHLVTMTAAREQFSLADGVIFENHANTLSDVAEDVAQRLYTHDQPSHAARLAGRPAPKPSYADQICVYRTTDGINSPRFVIEYKPPHKLSIPNLRVGLRPVHLFNDVVNRPTVPKDPEEKLIYNADMLVGAAVTQVFAYMVENALQYSYITTGEAFIFLHIQEDDPTTLYYHLAEPNNEIEAENGPVFPIFQTAIGQMLSFCLMALRSTPLSQEWRHNAVRKLHTWAVDFEVILSQIPKDERKQPPPSPAYNAPNRRIDPRSPYLFRPRRQRHRCGGSDDIQHDRDHTPDQSDDADDDDNLDTPSRPRAATTTKTKETPGPHPDSSSAGTQSRPFCTQKCLLGLVHGTALDESCANVAFHRGKITTRKHRISAATLALRIRQHLSIPRNLDRDCHPLGKQGSRGALFKVTLPSYGYTVAAKGTIPVFIPDLEHEGKAYRTLKKIQGDIVPVYLGNIDLHRCYFLNGVRIEHMLLMSWAGETVEDRTELKSSITIAEHIRHSFEAMQREGVFHEDVHDRNCLWNQEKQRVMLVDFSHSSFTRSEVITPLKPVSPNGSRHRVSYKKPRKISESDHFATPQNSRCAGTMENGHYSL